MALLTALLTGYAGYGQGRQQRLQNQQEQQRTASETAYQNAEIEQEKARTAAEQKTTALNATEQGYDPNTLKPLPLTGKYAKIPQNATYDDIATITARNYAQAIEQNDPQGIEYWGKAAATIPRGYGEVTNAQFTAGPKTALAEAQTKAMNDLPARAREIAAGHDAATLQRASMQMANSQALARYNYGARWNLAQLAGAYRLQGYDENNAARAAIADYEGQIRVQLGNAQVQGREFDTEYNDAARAGSSSYPKAPSGAVQPVPPVNVPINITLPPDRGAFQGPPPPVGGGTPGTPFASAPPRLPPPPIGRESGDPKVNEAITKLSKVPKAKIQGFVFDAVMAGRYTNSEAAEILKHYGLGPR
jgi:hypothetical protein